MTGLSLPHSVVIPTAMVILLRSVPESIQVIPILKAKLMTFNKHYKQTNDKLKEENISLKYIIKR